jgi:hypothetical protein
VQLDVGVGDVDDPLGELLLSEAGLLAEVMDASAPAHGLAGPSLLIHNS